MLSWWFETAHSVWNADRTVAGFQYYFAQREAVETVVYLHEAAKVRQPTDLIPFDSSGVVVPSRFDETWVRLVLKMATGSVE
ncbi:MAG: hypothetical protein M3Y08_19290 [Fibrobacterota bacterium]|nr:hypothetical protein [Fibrobacterota bacterium]